MRLGKTIALLFTFIVQVGCLRAQSLYDVPDPILLNWYQTNYPAIMVGDKIDSNQAVLSGTGPNDMINLSGLGLNDATTTELLFLIDSLDLSNNNLTFVPEFGLLRSLDYLDLSNNQLTDIPNLAYSSTVGHVLKWINVSNNPLGSIPDLSHVQDSLQVLRAINVELDTLIDYSSYSALTEVDLTFNDLTFADMLLSSSHVDFTDIFQFMPQNTFGNQDNYEEIEGGDLSISVHYPELTGGEIFIWHLNGDSLTATSTPTLNILSIDEADAGSYHVTVIHNNPVFQGISLESEPIDVTVLPCSDWTSISSQETTANCSGFGILTIDTTALTVSNSPLDFSILVNGNIISLSESSFKNVPVGNHNLIVNDSYNCTDTLKNHLAVLGAQGCDHVFSPNSDGHEDTFYISQSGEAKVINKAGETVKSLTTPTSWDGTNNEGQEAAPGYYAIYLNDSQILNVTLVR